MEQTAIVIATDGKYATVRVSRKAMCDGCHKTACGKGCAMSSLVAGGSTATANAINEVGAAVGDTVSVVSSDRAILTTAAAVFATPLVFGGAFYALALCLGASDTVSVCFAVLGFLAPFPFLRIAEKRRSGREPLLTVSRVVDTDENGIADGEDAKHRY